VHAISGRTAESGAAGTKQMGEIRFTARLSDDGQMMKLTVVDDGPGMSPEVLSRACEPHFTTRASTGGTGLGLTLVRGLLDDVGGGLRLASVEGVGTTVTIELPTRRD
jgi:signal transduction histidine kinase